jgi:ketosteroid isomerase-like protein
MDADLRESALEFTRMWCNLFVGDSPDIGKAMQYFEESASILIPSTPYRLRPEEDGEEIHFSHLVDGRGEVHFWQVLEAQVDLVGDVAIVSYYARYNIGRKGESVVRFAKESLVLIRRANDWRIVHMHNSQAL